MTGIGPEQSPMERLLREASAQFPRPSAEVMQQRFASALEEACTLSIEILESCRRHKEFSLDGPAMMRRLIKVISVIPEIPLVTYLLLWVACKEGDCATAESYAQEFLEGGGKHPILGVIAKGVLEDIQYMRRNLSDP